MTDITRGNQLCRQQYETVGTLALFTFCGAKCVGLYYIQHRLYLRIILNDHEEFGDEVV